MIASPFQSFIVTAVACGHFILLFRSRLARCEDFTFSDLQTDHD